MPTNDELRLELRLVARTVRWSRRAAVALLAADALAVVAYIVTRGYERLWP